MDIFQDDRCREAPLFRSSRRTTSEQSEQGGVEGFERRMIPRSPRPSAKVGMRGVEG